MNCRINTPWKQVVSVIACEDFVLELKWEDGLKTKVSLKSRINEREIFWRLRNPRYFKQVSVDPIGGICWPEGEDLSAKNLANDSLEGSVRYYKNPTEPVAEDDWDLL